MPTEIPIMIILHTLKKHDSIDKPDKPLFHNSKRKKDHNDRETSTGHSETNTTSSTSKISIGIAISKKRINLQSECMQQPDKWHQLLEKGTITETIRNSRTYPEGVEEAAILY